MGPRNHDSAIIRPRTDGPVGQLGMVYDAVGNKFLGINLYEDVPDDASIYTAAPSMTRKHLTASNFTDTLTQLDISAELQVHLKSEPICITGSASFHTMSYAFHDTTKIHDHLTYVTGSSSLLPDKCNPDMMTLEKMKDLGGTHIIVGITYGSRINLQYEQDINEYTDEMLVEGNLRIQAHLKGIEVDASASVKFKQEKKQKEEQREFQYTGDCPGPRSLTKDGIHQYLNEVQDLIDNIMPYGIDRPERGSIISYTMVPINTVISSAAMMLGELNKEQLKLITANQRDFEIAIQLINQILALDLNLGPFINMKDFKTMQELLSIVLADQCEYNLKVIDALKAQQRPDPNNQKADKRKIFEVNEWLMKLGHLPDDENPQTTRNKEYLRRVPKDPPIDPEENADLGDRFSRVPKVLFNELRDAEARRHDRIVLQRFFSVYNANIVSNFPDLQFGMERSQFMVFYLHTSQEKHIHYQDRADFLDLIKSVNMVKETFKVTCDFRVVNLDESTDLKKQKILLDLFGKDENGKYNNMRTFVNKASCKLKRLGNGDAVKEQTYDFGAEMHDMKMKLANRWISKEELHRLLEDDSDNAVSMRKIIEKKLQAKKNEASRKKQKGEEDKEIDLYDKVQQQIDAAKFLLTFDYKTEFLWKFDGPGYDYVCATTRGKIMTPQLLYYKIEDLIFTFSTPIGPKTANLNLMKLKKCINKEQKEDLPTNKAARTEPKLNLDDDLPLGAIVAYSLRLDESNKNTFENDLAKLFRPQFEGHKPEFVECKGQTLYKQQMEDKKRKGVLDFTIGDFPDICGRENTFQVPDLREELRKSTTDTNKAQQYYDHDDVKHAKTDIDGKTPKKLGKYLVHQVYVMKVRPTSVFHTAEILKAENQYEAISLKQERKRKRFEEVCNRVQEGLNEVIENDVDMPTNRIKDKNERLLATTRQDIGEKASALKEHQREIEASQQDIENYWKVVESLQNDQEIKELKEYVAKLESMAKKKFGKKYKPLLRERGKTSLEEYREEYASAADYRQKFVNELDHTHYNEMQASKGYELYETPAEKAKREAEEAKKAEEERLKAEKAADQSQAVDGQIDTGSVSETASQMTDGADINLDDFQSEDTADEDDADGEQTDDDIESEPEEVIGSAHTAKINIQIDDDFKNYDDNYAEKFKEALSQQTGAPVEKIKITGQRDGSVALDVEIEDFVPSEAGEALKQLTEGSVADKIEAGGKLIQELGKKLNRSDLDKDKCKAMLMEVSKDPERFAKKMSQKAKKIIEETQNKFKDFMSKGAEAFMSDAYTFLLPLKPWLVQDVTSKLFNNTDQLIVPHMKEDGSIIMIPVGKKLKDFATENSLEKEFMADEMKTKLLHMFIGEENLESIAKKAEEPGIKTEQIFKDVLKADLGQVSNITEMITEISNNVSAGTGKLSTTAKELRKKAEEAWENKAREICNNDTSKKFEDVFNEIGERNRFSDIKEKFEEAERAENKLKDISQDLKAFFSNDNLGSRKLDKVMATNSGIIIEIQTKDKEIHKLLLDKGSQVTNKVLDQLFASDQASELKKMFPKSVTELTRDFLEGFNCMSGNGFNELNLTDSEILDKLFSLKSLTDELLHQAEQGKYKIKNMIAQGKKKIKAVTDDLQKKLARAKLGFSEAIKVVREFIAQYNPGAFGEEWAKRLNKFIQESLKSLKETAQSAVDKTKNAGKEGLETAIKFAEQKLQLVITLIYEKFNDLKSIVDLIPKELFDVRRELDKLVIRFLCDARFKKKIVEPKDPNEPDIADIKPKGEGEKESKADEVPEKEQINYDRVKQFINLLSEDPQNFLENIKSKHEDLKGEFWIFNSGNLQEKFNEANDKVQDKINEAGQYVDLFETEVTTFIESVPKKLQQICQDFIVKPALKGYEMTKKWMGKFHPEELIKSLMKWWNDRMKQFKKDNGVSDDKTTIEALQHFLNDLYTKFIEKIEGWVPKEVFNVKEYLNKLVLKFLLDKDKKSGKTGIQITKEKKDKFMKLINGEEGNPGKFEKILNVLQNHSELKNDLCGFAKWGWDTLKTKVENFIKEIPNELRQILQEIAGNLANMAKDWIEKFLQDQIFSQLGKHQKTVEKYYEKFKKSFEEIFKAAIDIKIPGQVGNLTDQKWFKQLVGVISEDFKIDYDEVETSINDELNNTLQKTLQEILETEEVIDFDIYDLAHGNSDEIKQKLEDKLKEAKGDYDDQKKELMTKIQKGHELMKAVADCRENYLKADKIGDYIKKLLESAFNFFSEAKKFSFRTFQSVLGMLNVFKDGFKQVMKKVGKIIRYVIMKAKEFKENWKDILNEAIKIVGKLLYDTLAEDKVIDYCKKHGITKEAYYEMKKMAGNLPDPKDIADFIKDPNAGKKKIEQYAKDTLKSIQDDPAAAKAKTTKTIQSGIAMLEKCGYKDKIPKNAQKYAKASGTVMGAFGEISKLFSDDKKD